MDAAIDDALGVVQDVEPRKAVPMQGAARSRRRRGVLAVGVTSIAALRGARAQARPCRRRRSTPSRSRPTTSTRCATFLKEQEQKQQSDEAKDATREFNQLIEDLADKRLDRTDAFRTMQALEDKLQTGNEADKKALEEALQKMGEELKKSELTKPAGESLDNEEPEGRREELPRPRQEAPRERLERSTRRSSTRCARRSSRPPRTPTKRKDELEKKRDELKKEIDLLQEEAAGEPPRRRRAADRSGEGSPPEEGARARAPRSAGAAGRSEPALARRARSASCSRPPKICCAISAPRPTISSRAPRTSIAWRSRR